ncbi:MAG: bifunctional UDP-sugar hydrolase/5'-nucleotidase [Bacteroidota bacterium]
MRTFRFALLVALSFAAHAQPRLAPLTILHWNDFHASNEPFSVTVRDAVTGRDTTYVVGGTAYLLAYINKYRTSTPNALVLNAGDDFQGSPISTLTLGQSQIELMNIINPDAMTLGNHEFDYGSERLRQTLRTARFPTLAANIYDDRSRSTFREPTRIVTRGDLRVGIVGLTHPQLESLVIKDSLAGIKMLDVDSVLSWHINALKTQKVDLLIALTHAGLQNDSAIASRHPEIDIIVGGHDHVALLKPAKVNRTLIVQAGTRGRWLGKLELMVDLDGDSVFSYRGELVETRAGEIAPDSVAARKVEEFAGSIRATMNVVIGELKTPWTRNRSRERKESNVGNWQADVFRSYVGTDVAFQNSGGIRADLPAGPITVGDIWRMNPFGNHCVVFRVDGAMLRSLLEFQVSASMQAWLQVSGIRYAFDSRRPPGSRIVSVEVNGKPLDEKSLYSICTNNYVASNSAVHFGIDPAELTIEPLPNLDRDILIERIRRDRLISATVDGRIRDLADENK